MADLRIPYVHETLSNGLSVQIVPLNHLHRVEILFALRGGARFESKNENGISHVVEHLLFRGNELRPNANEVARAFDEIGAELEPSTSIDLVEYPVSLPPEHLEDGLRELFHVIATPLFRDLEIEREVLKEELREDLDEDGRDLNIDNLSRRALFGSGPLGQSIGGPISNLDRLEKEHLEEHHRRFYVGANAALTIAGRVETDSTLQAVRSIFSALPKGERLEPRTQSLAGVPKKRLSITSNDDPQSELRLAFLVPGVHDARYATIALLVELLDGGMGGLVRRRLVDERGLAYFAFASYDGQPDFGILELGGTLSHAKLPDFIEASLDLLEGLREHPVDARTLLSIKRRSRWAIESLIDEPDSIAQYFTENCLWGIDRPLEKLLRELENVTPAAIQRLAGEFLGREAACVAIVGDVSRADRARLKASLRIA